MIDLYGLGAGFPGTPPPNHLTNLEKVRYIESAFKDVICEQIFYKFIGALYQRFTAVDYPIHIN